MVTVSRIDPTDLTLQSYKTQDKSLISRFDVNNFLTGSSYIEFFIYNNNQNILYFNSMSLYLSIIFCIFIISLFKVLSFNS